MDKYLEIKGLERPICRLVMGSHCYAKEHDDLDFDTFYSLGGNCFHLYGEGGEQKSRINVAKWLEKRGVRNEMTLLFQICHGHDETTSNISESRFSSEKVSRDIDEQLELMNLDYLDLVYLGGDNEHIPVPDILNVLEVERSRGRIKAFGVKNWRPNRIEEALACYGKQEQASGIQFLITGELSSGNPTSPTWEEYVPVDEAMRTLLLKYQMPVFAWISDFNQSFFVPGNVDPNSVPDDRLTNRWYTEENFSILKKFKSEGDKLGLDVRQMNVLNILGNEFPVAGIFYQDHDPRTKSYFDIINLDDLT